MLSWHRRRGLTSSANIYKLLSQLDFKGLYEAIMAKMKHLIQTTSVPFVFLSWTICAHSAPVLYQTLTDTDLLKREERPFLAYKKDSYSNKKEFVFFKK